MKISLKDNINSLSFFKANFNRIVTEQKESHKPFVITQNGKAAGVFLDIDTWEELSKRIELLKLVNEGEESIRQGNSIPIAELKAAVKQEYGL